MSQYEPIVDKFPKFKTPCETCVHMKDPESRTCAAFPEEIPPRIWYGLENHKAPFPGDHGIQYQSK